MGFFDKFRKHKKRESQSSSGSSSEPTYSIQPHPATTNDPADLRGGGGLQSARDPAFALHNSTPGPVIPENLKDQPVIPRDELRAQAEELNKPQE